GWSLRFRVIWMQKRNLVALLLVIMPGTRPFAQTSRSDPVDIQSRFSTQLNLNLPRKWDGSIGYELRMIGNASVYHGSYLDGELGRALGKHLTLFTNYRFARVTNAVSHRFGVGAEAEKKMDHFSL